MEDSQIRTGRRSEGVFFAAISLVQKAVSGLGVFIAGLLLALVHFPQKASPEMLDPAIARNLALVYLPTVIVLFIVSIFCLLFYRIRREDHEENIRRLAGKFAHMQTVELDTSSARDGAVHATGAIVRTPAGE